MAGFDKLTIGHSTYLEGVMVCGLKAQWRVARKTFSFWRGGLAIVTCLVATAAHADDRDIFDIVAANEGGRVSDMVIADLTRQIAGPEGSTEVTIRDFAMSVSKEDCHAIGPIWPEDPPNVFGLCVVSARAWQISASYVVLVRFGVADAVSMIEVAVE